MKSEYSVWYGEFSTPAQIEIHMPKWRGTEHLCVITVQYRSGETVQLADRSRANALATLRTHWGYCTGNIIAEVF